MSNLPQSDWILAGRYVDGDLSAAEAAKAKSRIDSDEDFAAAVEEIRSQSKLFAGLPKFTPTDDLQDRTLQASLDQVKAIMGAWPIESDATTVTPANQEASEPFDWKSTAALVASLAGIFLVGAMLLQDKFGPAPEVASGTASPSLSPQVAGKAADFDSATGRDEPQVAKAESENVFEKSFASRTDEPGSKLAGKTPVAAKGVVPPLVTTNQMPEIGTILGTPAAKSSAARPTPAISKGAIAELASNVSAPVEQIWCVSQDINASRDSVCEILNSNQIQVQREDQPKPAYASPEAVEAFYVAATPKQMKLAMSQISNNADIEMIQLPKWMNSPIADAIAKQFSESESVPNEPVEQTRSAVVPQQFKTPASQALAQQLVSNAFPRNYIPVGPVPPILPSGTPIAGLDVESDVEDSDEVNSKAANEAPAVASKAQTAQKRTKADASVVDNALAKESTGFADVAAGGGAGMGGGVMMAPTTQMQQSNLSLPQQAELDKYLDDTDQQLRQYLILVRGGETQSEGK